MMVGMEMNTFIIQKIKNQKLIFLRSLFDLTLFV